MSVNIQNQIQNVWAVEQEILDVFDKVCKEHHLRYTLAYGTLIGAVRHKGFIPWDDDIDLMMPREDYEKLLRIWNQAVPTGYLLQNTRTDPDYTQMFTKIRKDHTTFLQDEAEAGKKYHKGVFIDIFPCDRVPRGKVLQMMQYAACAVNLLYTRGYTSGTSGVIGMIERVLLCLPTGFHPAMRDLTEKVICMWNGDSEGKYFSHSTIRESRWHLDPDLFCDMTEISFCGKNYSCIKNVDKLLRTQYGDYMRLPPEEERVWKHHPVLIDYTHNYEELSEKQ